MNNLERNYMETNIAAQIMSETMRLNRLDTGQKPTVDDVEPIPLDDFREAFESYGDDFLSDELLNRVLAGVEKNYDSIKENYPEGSKLLVAAFPCNINGSLFSDEAIKDGQYLTTLFIDKKTGLNVGFGALSPSTHAKMLPEEIQEKCSFEVHYDSTGTYPSDEKDFEQFAEQYRNAYHELRKLLKSDQ